MNDKNKALRLALEALENSEPNKRKGDDDCREIGWMEHREAITAIKAALEAKGEPCCYGGIAHDCHAGSGCKIAERLKTSAKVKDEPVAWMYEVNHAHTCLDLFEPPDDAYDEGTLYPLYTTPPQRKPLTDEEIEKLFLGATARTHLDAAIAFARAIEAKLKEKNT